MITITHRIQLMPNNKQKTYFRKAIGCCRLAYNWGLAEWIRRYKDGDKGMDAIKIRNAFNAIRREQFPFTYNVTKYATAHAFDDLQWAFENYFAHRANYPKPHKKKDGCGSFYLGNDAIKLSETRRWLKHLENTSYNIKGNHQYMNVPHLGYVKMSEHLRFDGKVMGVRIKQEGEKFFAYFQMKITEEEYRRTHPYTNNKKAGNVGIDLGLKETMTLSDGIAVNNPRILHKHQRKINNLSRQLSKRCHAKTKQERLQGIKMSNNYKKMARCLGKEQRHVSNIRCDFQQKLTTILTTIYETLIIEDLNVVGIQKRHNLAKSAIDAGLGTICRLIKEKAKLNGASIVVANRFYPSSKTCSYCGYKREDLKLNERTFVCPHCGRSIDRDFNASLNLLGLIKNKNVGMDCPELTPVDLTALLSRFALNRIATSKVETGMQHKSVSAL